MPYDKFLLPEYPVISDMWDELSKEKRPIVVYGMGNGADKLISHFERYNIKISDFFASDGFVRGHFFHGMRVKSFSEIREAYDSFVIVLSFASNRPEVLDMLYSMDEKYDMYVPDMPVAGEEYFDRAFYNENYESIVAAYDALSDGESKNAYCAMLNYKLTGRIKYLRSAFSNKDEMYSLLPCESIRNIVDAGAYNGDTIREAREYFSNLQSAVAIEPDAKNYKKLARYCEAETNIEIKPINAAAWCDEGRAVFASSGNRNSSATSTVSYEHKSTDVALVKIDSVAHSDVDYIKYDVEGAELEALSGSEETILRNKPALLISLYHRSRDIFDLINRVKSLYPFYNLYVRRLECLPAWELNLIAIRNEDFDI